jgi:hypothetical protein
MLRDEDQGDKAVTFTTGLAEKAQELWIRRKIEAAIARETL